MGRAFYIRLPSPVKTSNRYDIMMDKHNLFIQIAYGVNNRLVWYIDPLKLREMYNAGCTPWVEFSESSWDNLHDWLQVYIKNPDTEVLAGDQTIYEQYKNKKLSIEFANKPALDFTMNFIDFYTL